MTEDFRDGSRSCGRSERWIDWARPRYEAEKDRACEKQAGETDENGRVVGWAGWAG